MADVPGYQPIDVPHYQPGFGSSSHPVIVGPTSIVLLQDVAGLFVDVARVAGDVLQELDVVLSDQNGPVDLTGAMVSLILTSQRGYAGILTTSAAMTPVPGQIGRVSCVWPSGMIAGDYTARIVAIWPDQTSIHFPNNTALRVLILSA